MQKFVAYDVPQNIVIWSQDFLANHKQTVHIGNIFSYTVTINAGVPQGIILEQMILHF
jgi:hypothetical protein